MLTAHTLTRTLSAVLVAASLAAAPAFAQAPAGAGHNNGLETRISELHKKLQITPEQEPKWKAVADVMHANAETSRTLVEEKRKDEANMTAVADLNAYAEVAELHAKHVRELATVFSDLYDTMSPDQKKVADKVFQDHKRKAAKDLAQHGAK